MLPKKMLLIGNEICKFEIAFFQNYSELFKEFQMLLEFSS